MKAAVCHAFGQPLEIEDVNLATASRGQVRVDLAACAICHSDISFIDGSWGGALPAVYGHEAAGVVAEVGPGVSDYSIGDRVLVTLIRACGACGNCQGGHPTDCSDPYDRMSQSPITDAAGQKIEQGMATGAFAQSVVVDHSQLALLPDTIDLKVASLLACGAITGLGAVINAAKVPNGANVAVVGAGGVGLNAVQGCAINGADKIIALDLDQAKLDGAREFGATHGVIAADADVADQIRAITDGRGVDYVFVTVGAIQAFQGALDYLAPRGELVMVGMPPTGAEMTLEPVNIASASQVLRGTKMGDAVLQRDIPKLLDWYAQGLLKLDELVAGEYPLEKINDAIAATKAGSAGRNIIVF